MRPFKTALKHIRRTPYQALAAVFIMAITFLAVSVFCFIVIGSTLIINYFESRPQVIAFFKDEAKQTDIDALLQDMKKTGKISQMRFISKKEALEIYKEQNKSDPLLLDLVTADILPASVEISTYKLDDLEQVSNTLKNSILVSDINYPKNIISSLESWTNGIRTVGLALVGILALESIFIVMLIIGFKVSQKREEIEIMKLLSASNWYIRWPFILEGIIYGLLGTLIGWLTASAGLFYATPFLAVFLNNIPILPVSPVFLLELLSVEMVIAVILGTFASSLAVLRHLK